MDQKVRYYCPEDPEQELYCEDPGLIGLIVADLPVTCPKCNKSYYKWECISDELDDLDGDED